MGPLVFWNNFADVLLGIITVMWSLGDSDGVLLDLLPVVHLYRIFSELPLTLISTDLSWVNKEPVTSLWPPFEVPLDIASIEALLGISRAMPLDSSMVVPLESSAGVPLDSSRRAVLATWRGSSLGTSTGLSFGGGCLSSLSCVSGLFSLFPSAAASACSKALCSFLFFFSSCFCSRSKRSFR